MHLIQILLPRWNNEGSCQPPELFAQVRQELVEHFGGLTAYTRAPAEGLWRDADAQTTADDVLVYEVMVQTLDRVWWKQYRKRLETAFCQAEVIVRALAMEQL
jgi:hypothetical protein